MERRSLNCPPVVEPNQLGCSVWNLSCMLHHHHHRHGLPNQKLLTNESHGSNTLTGTVNTRSQARILGFDEQLKGINNEPRRKDTIVGSRERSGKKFMEAETSSSMHMKRQQREVGRDSSQISVDICLYDEGFCSQIPRKTESSRLGKTKKQDQLVEKNVQLLQMSTEERLLERLFKSDCSGLQSRQFSDALEIVKSNKETFLKLLRDPNSLLAKHAQRLRDLQSEEDTVTTVPRETSSGRKLEQPVYNMDVWKNNVEKSFWRKIKSRHEHHPNKKKNSGPLDRIVVLKPGQQTEQIQVDTGCFYFQPHHSSRSNQQIVKQSYFPFSSFTKKLKNSRKQKKTKGEDEIRTSSQAIVVKGEQRGKEIRNEVGESASERSNLSVVPYSKHQDLDIFVEARRRLAERLKKVSKGEASSSRQAPRTLERVLLSSPKHHLMATHSPNRDGNHERFSFCENPLVGSKESLRTLNEGEKWSVSSPLKQNNDSSSTCCMKIKDADEFRLGDIQNHSNTGLEHYNVEARAVDRCFEGSRMEFSLDISSPKAESMCKFENMDNDQYRGENPSPVSVLESAFIDNISSPTSTSESVEHHTHPRRLDFEEQSQTSSPQHPKTSSSTCLEDRGFISAYVNTIYQASEQNWEEFLTDDCLKESSVDEKLLHDCIKEVLLDLHQTYIDCSPWITFLKSHAVSFDTIVVNEVMEKVDFHILPSAVPRTMDQLVRRDIAKSGEWVDVKTGTQEIVIEVVDETLERLITEAILDLHS